MPNLILGPILFADFEIPESLPWGGAQELVKKKLVGGARVIDAMGPDDSDLDWSGRFRGANAETRAQELDFLRKQGQQLVLTWSSFRYLVIIQSFKPDYRQPFEIPYSISCMAVEDLTNPIPPPPLDIDAAINGDVSAASLLATTMGIAQITSAVAGVASATNAVAKFAGASPAQVAGVQSSIQTALGVVNSQQVVATATVTPTGSVAGVTAGLAPQALAASLSGQSAAFVQLGQLYQLQALLQRTSINVTNAGN